jgi:hypothetical protein
MVESLEHGGVGGRCLCPRASGLVVVNSGVPDGG